MRGNDVTGPYGDFYNAYGNMLALYLQDSWTIANRFTINFGVRAESEYIPSYATGNPDFENLKPIEFGFGDKLAPRLGFVWDVKGDSSLKVFGSYGLFYDVMKLEMAAGSYGGFKWKSAYYALDTYEWDKIGVGGNFPGRLLLPAQTFDFRAPSFDTTDPDMKPMSQQEISLGLEKRAAGRPGPLRPLGQQAPALGHRGHRHPAARRRTAITPPTPAATSSSRNTPRPGPLA